MKHAQPITIVLVILALAAIGGSGIYRLVRPEGTTDFDGFYTIGRAVVDCTDIYEDKAGRRYPPTFALFMAPFALLPYRSAGIVFIALGNLALIVAACASARIAYRGSGTTGSSAATARERSNVGQARDEPLAHARGWDSRANCAPGAPNDFKPGWNHRTVVPCLLACMFIAGNLFLCQVNLVVLALGMLGLLWASQGKTLRAVPALALAIALKVTPALFLPYFLVKRRFNLFLLTTG